MVARWSWAPVEGCVFSFDGRDEGKRLSCFDL